MKLALSLSLSLLVWMRFSQVNCTGQCHSRRENRASERERATTTKKMRDAALLPGRKEGKRASRVEHQCTLTNPMVELILPVFFSGPLSLTLPLSSSVFTDKYFGSNLYCCESNQPHCCTGNRTQIHIHTHSVSLSLSLSLSLAPCVSLFAKLFLSLFLSLSSAYSALLHFCLAQYSFYFLSAAIHLTRCFTAQCVKARRKAAAKKLLSLSLSPSFTLAFSIAPL